MTDCIKCGEKIYFENDVVCIDCYEKYSLCLFCGVNKIHDDWAVCKGCHLKAYGKCDKCDEPRADGGNILFCDLHLGS